MKIYIKYNHPILKKIIKKADDELTVKEGAMIKDLLTLIQDTYKLKNLLFDSNFKNLKVSILLNGFSIDNLSTKLKNNDKVNFLYLTTGG